MSTNKQALREQVIIDISKNPLIKQAYEVCQAIEKCGASLEITGAVTKASALMQGIANAMALLDKWQQESSTWQSVAEKQLAIATEMEAKLQAAEKRIAELEALDKPKFVQCWSCKHDIEVLAIADCDGYCPQCDSPIDLDDEPYAATDKGE